ncbi:MAG: exodeoxyribonuclease VII small subunit [Clostridia bacterium]|nr:exodeoxyribonuclease VII small subunit [Clostridia bacterium]
MTEEKKETLSFEERLQSVQNLAERIESGKLSLEDSVREYEEGMKILAGLDQELKEMNRRLTVLRDGKETEVDDPDL